MRYGVTLVALSLAASAAHATDSTFPRCPEDLKADEPVVPIYPSDRYEEAWVVVEFVVQSDGSTANPRVIESSSRIFERSAVRAILKTRYAERTEPCLHRERLNYSME